MPDDPSWVKLLLYWKWNNSLINQINEHYNLTNFLMQKFQQFFITNRCFLFCKDIKIQFFIITNFSISHELSELTEKNGSALEFCGNGLALFSIDRMDLHFQFDCWNWSFDTASSLSRCGLGSEHNHHNFTGINVIPHDHVCDR